MTKEFREFIARGNAIDLAIGLVLGVAFGAIVASLVNDVIMPLVGVVLGGVDFSNMFITVKEGVIAAPYPTVVAAQEAGAVTVNYGAFINTIVSFVIIALVVFLLVKGINKIRKPAEAPATKDCPYCLTAVPEAATRCAACTSQLTGA